MGKTSKGGYFAMVRHLILMSSSYSQGTRIALDFKNSQLDIEFILQQIKTIKKACGDDVSLSTHFIDAEKDTWDSVIEADSFFKNVLVVDDVKQFITLVKADLTLTGLDVAKYILSQTACTHLKLQKLTYLCYADYLYYKNKKLFKDKIYAYKYGPVVNSVYKEFKAFGYDQIEDNSTVTIGEIMLPIRSRILFSSDGIEKIKSIDTSLKRYENLSAKALVQITHQIGSPWNLTPQSTIIKDTTIKEHHRCECED